VLNKEQINTQINDTEVLHTTVELEHINNTDQTVTDLSQTTYSVLKGCTIVGARWPG